MIGMQLLADEAGGLVYVHDDDFYGYPRIEPDAAAQTDNVLPAAVACHRLRGCRAAASSTAKRPASVAKASQPMY